MVKEVVKKNRVTEKGSYLAEKNVYTFNVADDANKTEVKKAIFKQYKVLPVKINILKVPTKNKNYRGRPGTRSGGKKAFVYLKKGDKIEFV